MIRAVIDTNLLVSYALTKGATLSRLIAHWEKATFVYLMSTPMVEELRDVLKRPRLREKMIADLRYLIDIVEMDTERVAGELVLAGVCRDPKDDIFIACAVEGEADYIVSGDKDLLDLGEYKGIRVIRAGEFVVLLDALERVRSQGAKDKFEG